MRLSDILDVNPTLDAYRISFLTNRYVTPLAKELASRYGLAWQEWVILFCLAQKRGLTGKEISDVTGRPQNTISDGIRKLLLLQLVRREPNAVDRRSMVLHLRPKGRALYNAMLPRLQAQQERVLGTLSARERDQLGRLLHKLVHSDAKVKET